MSEICPFSQGFQRQEVEITEEESFRIRLMGYYDVSFMRRGQNGKRTLIFLHGHCVFEKSGMCSISVIKPSACRNAERFIGGSIGDLSDVEKPLKAEVPSLEPTLPPLMRRQ